MMQVGRTFKAIKSLRILTCNGEQKLIAVMGADVNYGHGHAGYEFSRTPTITL
jgi:hypothetical protein